MGSALSKRGPVHVFSTEHFCKGWHTWTCAATPLFDADTHETIGVIDFTTVGKNYQEQALSLNPQWRGPSRLISSSVRCPAHYLLQRYESSLRPLSGGKPDSVGRTRPPGSHRCAPARDRAPDAAIIGPMRRSDSIRAKDTGQFLGTAYVLTNDAFRGRPICNAPNRPRHSIKASPRTMVDRKPLRQTRLRMFDRSAT